jgi:hypothetical protein
MLKSMLSVEQVHVVVAITDNVARLRIANSIRGLGGMFFTAVHPAAYASMAAVIGDGTVLAAGAVVHPEAAVGSHCYVGTAGGRGSGRGGRRWGVGFGGGGRGARGPGWGAGGTRAERERRA